MPLSAGQVVDNRYRIARLLGQACSLKVSENDT
jgi:hypothetical protein